MRRREFVIKSGLATVGVTASATAMDHVVLSKSPNDTINIGVIGTGDRGGGLIPVINGIKNLNVAACCDILPFRLEHGINKTEGRAKAYSDYRKLLDDNDLDAILVTTPFNTHAKIPREAFEVSVLVFWFLVYQVHLYISRLRG